MKFEIDIRFSGLTTNLKKVRIDGNYSKKDEFFRNRSGGWYSLFVSKLKVKLEALLITEICKSGGIKYKKVFAGLSSGPSSAFGSI